MIDILYVFLISISPFGEARVGIPFGILKKIPVVEVFLIGCGANLLVFPLFYKSITGFNKLLWNRRWYKKIAIFLGKRAKVKTKKGIEKYGTLGLFFFVMIPLPITGAYIGTLAAYILGLDYKKSLIAISLGVIVSSIVITVGMYFGNKIV